MNTNEPMPFILAFFLTLGIFMYCVQLIAWVVFIKYADPIDIKKRRYHILLLVPMALYVDSLIKLFSKR